MSRTALLALAAVTALAAAPAGAAPARTVQAPYTGAVGSPALLLTVYTPAGPVGSTTVFPSRGERWVHLTMTDETGAPVWFTASQDAKLVDGTPDTALGSFCGATPKPVRLRSDVGHVEVWPRAGTFTCGAGVSVPTRGVVTARFTR